MTDPYSGGSSALGSDPYAGGASAYGTDVEPTQERTSLGELLGRVTADLSTLLRQEVALAKAEARQTATKAGTGIGLFVGAAIGAIFVLSYLTLALWWAIGNATGRGWAALIVAGIWLVITIILALVGKSEFQKAKGLPETADTVGKIPNALKGKEEENR